LKAKFNPMDPHYTEECWITNRADGIDPQINYMIQNERIVRIVARDRELGGLETVDPHVATEQGIRIGSTEAQLRKAYGASLIKQPPGQDEVYLYVERQDGQRTLLFETYEDAVINLRTGLPSAVHLIEGCS
jgi:hypothetical protein